jgi:peptide/nickel transport system substrate-binding protein
MHFNIIFALLLLVGMVSCTQKPVPSSISLPTLSTQTPGLPTNTVPELTPTGTQLPPPERLLTICLGHEPNSLFYYDAVSTSAQDVLAAIFDGPMDIRNYTEYPVILENIPSLSNDTSRLEPVQVMPGDLIVDRSGNPVNLDSGVEFRPSGCSEISCTQTYSGDQPVTMDQWVLDFKLTPGILWSDGTPLTSADSLYSYEIARSLYPAAQPELVLRTQSYQALDQYTVEWKGVPGYQDGIYHTKFFTPLPQHAWSSYSADELHTAEVSSRRPIGWGPYVIDQWIAGDHISLHKNPLYFRTGENLPRFDNLVFRFVSSTDEALDALQVGECDLVDQTAMFDAESSRLVDQVNNNQAQVFYLPDAGWEQITFGIAPLDSERPKFFALSQVRQAVAMCVDREALVAGQALSTQQIADIYVPSTHPLYNPDIQQYKLDLQQASAMLESAGWLDTDNDPQTPRVAQGLAGVPDGTPFEVEYLVSSDPGPQADATAIQAMLGNCGIKATIFATSPQKFLTPGPNGPVFGRAFDLAQFAWAGSYEPPCNLYLSGEIPGPYPDFPKGWGGVNASGYSNSQYDEACENALFSLADAPIHQSAHYQAQQIFSTDLPALPLYFHYNVSAARPDLCNFKSISAVDTPLWFIELLDDGSGCSE